MFQNCWLWLVAVTVAWWVGDYSVSRAGDWRSPRSIPKHCWWSTLEQQPSTHTSETLPTSIQSVWGSLFCHPVICLVSHFTEIRKWVTFEEATGNSEVTDSVGEQKNNGIKMTNHPQIAISTGLAELAHTEYQVYPERILWCCAGQDQNIINFYCRRGIMRDRKSVV